MVSLHHAQEREKKMRVQPRKESSLERWRGSGISKTRAGMVNPRDSRMQGSDLRAPPSRG